MRSIWKDVAAAFCLGMILPGILLNGAVTVLGHRTPVQTIQVTVPDKPQQTSLPVRIRDPEGKTELWDMDSYLTGVLLAEMPASFEPEALKAQAVAARTYARKAWETGGKHADGSVCTQSGCCQAYLPKEAFLSEGGTEADYEKIRSAVQATTGECLKYGDELIEATYFSCSGGKTEDALAVWGTDYPYLQSVDSPGEEQARWYTDTVTFSPEAFQQALGIQLEGDPSDWFGTRIETDGGGVAFQEIGGRLYSGTQLRSLLGLRSTAFKEYITDQSLEFVTKGYGHRVGMSQYGAEAMAVTGSTYDQILAHYYPGTVLVKIEPEPDNP